MHPRSRTRRSRAVGGLTAALATAGSLALLSACGSPPSPSAGAGALTPGAGQHQTAGMPGAGGPHDAVGSASPASSMPSMTMTESPHSAQASTAPVTGNAVAMKNFAFAPATLKVKVGTKVTWTNEDTDAHTVTSSGSGGPLHSTALDTHASYSYTFTKPGTYAYLCTIHPFMIATVEVTS
ncbi:cupredoxin family copper-binding protein [Streptomyces sp. NPDC046759]|uniref:cupredoxin domain-containing protein n=1 Tax=Streptomyces sp. NPDC046759 TaxID=3155019 RepID=UPI0033CAED83